MHKTVLLFLFCFLGMSGYSQQQYFVYIQADGNQPFYVRMNEKIHSSSESGYLILSKLNQGNYEFFVGFARNAYPEQKFRLQVGNKDKGYQLKNFQEKGWGLVDLQSQEIVMNADAASGSAMLTGEKKTDPFSVMLANVVNDSAILYTQVKPAEPVASSRPQEAKNIQPSENKETANEDAAAQTAVAQTTDTAAHLKTLPEKTEVVVTNSPLPAEKVTEKEIVPGTTPPIKKDAVVVGSSEEAEAKTPVTAKAAIEKPFITRIKEVKSPESYQAVYLEQYNYSTDTIDILIPAETAVASRPTEPVTQRDQPVTVPADKTEYTGKEESGKSVVLQMGSVADTFAVKKRTIIMVNSDCKNFATENDVDKLRIRILDEKTIDEKLGTARKYFKNKCFTVKQLRALTELFPTDETKYRFLDLSYAFASDSGNYYLLEEVMGEDYYRNRFRAMIRK